MPDVTYEQFLAVFRQNIERRSRSAKGTSDTSTSAKKRPLLLAGADLERQVARNTEQLAGSLWEYGKDFQLTRVTPLSLRGLFERWDGIINAHLIVPDAYAEEIAILAQEAEKLNKAEHRNGRNRYVINPRYRVWEVSYTAFPAPPISLEFFMDAFYERLSADIHAQLAFRKLSSAGILAYADYMIDKAIHPWADGCGRNATAAVMWLALMLDTEYLPVFGSRAEHYEAIQTLETHTIYMQRCLQRKP